MSTRETDAENILIPAGTRYVPGQTTTTPAPIAPGSRITGVPDPAAQPESTYRYTPPTPGPVEGQTSEAVSRAARIASQGYRSSAEQALRDAGVNTGDFRIQYYLDSVDASSDAYNDGSRDFEAELAAFMQSPIVQELLPDFFRAQQASGFSGQPFIEVGVTTPSEVAGVPEYQTVTSGQEYQVHPDTGWIQYRNGVLVDPSQPLGSLSAVFFQPGFTGPGSNEWRNDIQSWSEDKVNDWRSKLVKMGYLDGPKKGGVDVPFLNAIQTYQVVRYQNRGKELPWDATGAAGTGQTPFNFQQLKGQVSNGVTEQFRALYGTDPTDQELDKWTEYIIRSSKKLYGRGQLSAPGAVAESEERFIQRFEGTPEAEFVRENTEENTKMHDTILRSVMVAEAMS